MLCRITLSVLALTITAMSADAADLSTPGRLGAIFEEPAAVRVDVYRPRKSSELVIGYNLLPSFPWARGGYYYGSQWSSYYGGPYYGGPEAWYGSRLPYVCGLFGYCF